MQLARSLISQASVLDIYLHCPESFKGFPTDPFFPHGEAGDTRINRRRGRLRLWVRRQPERDGHCIRKLSRCKEPSPWFHLTQTLLAYHWRHPVLACLSIWISNYSPRQSFWSICVSGLGNNDRHRSCRAGHCHHSHTLFVKWALHERHPVWRLQAQNRLTGACWAVFAKGMITLSSVCFKLLSFTQSTSSQNCTDSVNA
jgi:hypothetical protein